MKTKTMIATALLTAGLGLGAVSTTVNAKATTIPKNIRGTWYHKYPYDPAFNTNPYVTKIKMYAHSETIKDGNKKSFIIGKNHLMGNNFKSKFRFKGGKYHIVTVHVIGMGDAPAYISAHIRINGHKHHVLLEAPQQGHTFDVFTHFKPTKNYHIQGTIKY
ncbi:hypothetical protein [Lentilactobacillus sunkii]|uniref:Uncharacterized protein n=1 Tax=Lentilactobacillus sunkii DSM 19904 TaxID=1423808 RepID=A0A0R1L0Z4_9LACO|nr:hypothetical protein [Lentilactobacillus sunkii]KRK89549.1 hypothetical protein FD17_GL001138 [Lentilactobacillus sunkii DSM 19904]